MGHIPSKWYRGGIRYLRHGKELSMVDDNIETETETEVASKQIIRGVREKVRGYKN